MSQWDAVHKTLVAFCPCPECSGQGMVYHKWYNTQTDQEDGDYSLCGECHGSGTTEAVTVLGLEAAESQSPC